MEFNKGQRTVLAWSFICGVVVAIITMSILFKVMLDDVKDDLIDKKCIEYDPINDVYVWANYLTDSGHRVKIE